MLAVNSYMHAVNHACPPHFLSYGYILFFWGVVSVFLLSVLGSWGQQSCLWQERIFYTEAEGVLCNTPSAPSSHVHLHFTPLQTSEEMRVVDASPSYGANGESPDWWTWVNTSLPSNHKPTPVQALTNRENCFNYFLEKRVLSLLFFSGRRWGEELFASFAGVFCVGHCPQPGRRAQPPAWRCGPPQGSAPAPGHAWGQWGAGLHPQHVPTGSFSSITASCLDCLLLHN